ncbi:SAM-dependent methyltransferase [Deltaproteobacteria bacterium Smac51]|nr:SAM-dependent methyltransferase [Deltaproteobacteria bacterium Smac51]
MTSYIRLNKANWDERAPLHAASKEYDLSSFINDPEHISEVVRFDRPLLGDISGRRGIHLQCHIGTDTISLARLGAAMTGLDFSPASIAQARLLSEKCGTQAQFIESEVYSALQAAEPSSFDFVYTGIGALCWLPDIDQWARIVSGLLRPGGRLFIREAHPILWSLDESRQDALVVRYPYFEQKEPMIWDDETTYVDTDGRRIQSTVTHEWNHGLGEIFTALLNHRMEIAFFHEHDCVPWEALPGQMVLENEQWRLAADRHRLPLAYTLQAVKL